MSTSNALTPLTVHYPQGGLKRDDLTARGDGPFIPPAQVQAIVSTALLESEPPNPLLQLISPSNRMADCYRNVALQVLMHTKPLLNFVYDVARAHNGPANSLTLLRDIADIYWDSNRTLIQRIAAIMPAINAWYAELDQPHPQAPNFLPWSQYGNQDASGQFDAIEFLEYCLERMHTVDLIGFEKSALEAMARFQLVNRRAYNCSCKEKDRQSFGNNDTNAWACTVSAVHNVNLADLIGRRMHEGNAPMTSVCPACQATGLNFDNYYRLRYLPEVLCVSIDYSTNPRASTAVSNQLDLQHISDYAPPEGRSTIYQLQCVLEYYSATAGKSGHYTVNVRQADGQWVYIDDTLQWPVSAPASRRQVPGGFKDRMCVYVRIPNKDEGVDKTDAQSTAIGGTNAVVPSTTTQTQLADGPVNAATQNQTTRGSGSNTIQNQPAGGSGSITTQNQLGNSVKQPSQTQSQGQTAIDTVTSNVVPTAATTAATTAVTTTATKTTSTDTPGTDQDNVAKDAFLDTTDWDKARFDREFRARGINGKGFGLAKLRLRWTLFHSASADHQLEFLLKSQLLQIASDLNLDLTQIKNTNADLVKSIQIARVPSPRLPSPISPIDPNVGRPNASPPSQTPASTTNNTAPTTNTTAPIIPPMTNAMRDLRQVYADLYWTAQQRESLAARQAAAANALRVAAEAARDTAIARSDILQADNDALRQRIKDLEAGAASSTSVASTRASAAVTVPPPSQPQPVVQIPAVPRPALPQAQATTGQPSTSRVLEVTTSVAVNANDPTTGAPTNLSWVMYIALPNYTSVNHLMTRQWKRVGGVPHGPDNAPLYQTMIYVSIDDQQTSTSTVYTWQQPLGSFHATPSQITIDVDIVPAANGQIGINGYGSAGVRKLGVGGAPTGVSSTTTPATVPAGANTTTANTASPSANDTTGGDKADPISANTKQLPGSNTSQHSENRSESLPDYTTDSSKNGDDGNGHGKRQRTSNDSDGADGSDDGRRTRGRLDPSVIGRISQVGGNDDTFIPEDFSTSPAPQSDDLHAGDIQRSPAARNDQTPRQLLPRQHHRPTAISFEPILTNGVSISNPFSSPQDPRPIGSRLLNSTRQVSLQDTFSFNGHHRQGSQTRISDPPILPYSTDFVARSNTIPHIDRHPTQSLRGYRAAGSSGLSNVFHHINGVLPTANGNMAPTRSPSQNSGSLISLNGQQDQSNPNSTLLGNRLVQGTRLRTRMRPDVRNGNLGRRRQPTSGFYASSTTRFLTGLAGFISGTGATQTQPTQNGPVDQAQMTPTTNGNINQTATTSTQNDNSNQTQTTRAQNGQVDGSHDQIVRYITSVDTPGLQPGTDMTNSFDSNGSQTTSLSPNTWWNPPALPMAPWRFDPPPPAWRPRLSLTECLDFNTSPMAGVIRTTSSYFSCPDTAHDIASTDADPMTLDSSSATDTVHDAEMIYDTSSSSAPAPGWRGSQIVSSSSVGPTNPKSSLQRVLGPNSPASVVDVTMSSSPPSPDVGSLAFSQNDLDPTTAPGDVLLLRPDVSNISPTSLSPAARVLNNAILPFPQPPFHPVTPTQRTPMQQIINATPIIADNSPPTAPPSTPSRPPRIRRIRISRRPNIPPSAALQAMLQQHTAQMAIPPRPTNAQATGSMTPLGSPSATALALINAGRNMLQPSTGRRISESSTGLTASASAETATSDNARNVRSRAPSPKPQVDDTETDITNTETEITVTNTDVTNTGTIVTATDSDISCTNTDTSSSG